MPSDRYLLNSDFIVEHGLNQPNSTKTVELFPYMMKALRKMEETGLDTNVLGNTVSNPHAVGI